ncbi:hypothetical protein B0H11DRAFT_2239098 [Mycena galericulata]|nr:hypothetical protein B0H11DRAFT_2239098 [Mycena galericulata]
MAATHGEWRERPAVPPRIGALSSRVEGVAHMGTDDSHAVSHMPRGFASAARGRLRIQLYQRKGGDIPTHNVSLVIAQ